MSSQATTTSETVDTVVVGGGQAGLSMSYHLSRQGIAHVVLERARIGERWRTERWDSLRFQFPNRYVRLPGFDYDGKDQTGFMTPAGIVDVIERYANRIGAPVRCGVNVNSVKQEADGSFTLATNNETLHTRNVILATGPYQRPLVPSISAQMPAYVRQLTANRYSNAQALPAGAVVVVGSGGSGVQIAEDLVASGRDTYLCVGQHRRVPRRFRGRDVMDWLEQLGMTSEPVLERPEIDHAPLLTGVDGGYDVDLREFARRGGHLLGRLEAVQDGTLHLGGDLLQDIANGDEAFRQSLAAIAAQVDMQDERQRNAAKAQQASLSPVAPSPTTLDIESAGITSVIWATGYGLDFSWVHCGHFNADGTPQQERGISAVPGLYFLGLPFMHTARSSFFWGVGDDAEYLAEHIVERRCERA